MTTPAELSSAWEASLRHVLEGIFNPFFMVWLLAFMILVRVWRRDSSVVVRTSVLLVMVASLLLSTGWLPRWVTYQLEHDHEPIVTVDKNIHWVVVLGGGVYETDALPVSEVLSGVSIKRLLEGVRLYCQLPDAQLILSGGGAKHPGESVGARMGELAGWFDIPAADRIQETIAINTADEAIAIKQWVHQEPFYLVTSAIHMPRAMALCRQQGLNPIAAPCEYTHYWEENEDVRVYMPNIKNVLYMNIAWHEVLGFVWSKVRAMIG